LELWCPAHSASFAEWAGHMATGGWLASCSVEDVAEGEAGFESCDAREMGEVFLVEAAVVVDVGDAGYQHVVVLARHEVATDHLFAMTDGGLKGGEDGGGLALEGDADVDGHALAEEAVVNEGTVTADGSSGFKGLDAAGGGGGGEADGFADFVVGGAAMVLKVAEDGGVEFVEALDGGALGGGFDPLVAGCVHQDAVWLTFRSHEAVLPRSLHTLPADCTVGCMRLKVTPSPGAERTSSKRFIRRRAFFALQFPVR